MQKRYKDMRANLKKLEAALKQRHAAIIKTEQARFEVRAHGVWITRSNDVMWNSIDLYVTL